MEQLVFAAVAGMLAAIGTTVVGVIASRKFGLPGLARQVDSEQAALIDTLQDRLELAEKASSEAKAASDETERRRQQCEMEIRQVKRDLRDTEAELLELYRKTGKRPPARLTDHEGEAET